MPLYDGPSAPTVSLEWLTHYSLFALGDFERQLLAMTSGGEGLSSAGPSLSMPASNGRGGLAGGGGAQAR